MSLITWLPRLRCAMLRLPNADSEIHNSCGVVATTPLGTSAGHARATAVAPSATTTAPVAAAMNSTARCGYAATASRDYFIGLSVMLHSLYHVSSSSSSDCRVLLLLWHPSLPDTDLLPWQREHLTCVAGRHTEVRWQQVDDQRLAVWRRVPVARPSALKALLKLELLFLEATPALNAVAFFDSDFLVLKRPGFIWPDVSAANGTRWKLHGSCSMWPGTRAVCPRHLNTGFFALSLPAPAPLRTFLGLAVANFTARGKVAKNGDQTVLMHALDNWHLAARGRAKHKRKLPRPHSLWIHRDWWLNYRPRTAAHISSWQAVHWQGTAKPCSSALRGPFDTGMERAIPELRGLWLDECRRLANSACAETQSQKERVLGSLEGVCSNSSMRR